MPTSLSKLLAGASVALVLLVAGVAGMTWWSDQAARIRHEAEAATGGDIARAMPIMTANG
ncbi:cytochrome C, partial [Mesorhizobium sp. M7A.F.Ca.US.001.01.1.1]